MSLASFLDVSREPEKADLIFVFAGRRERKTFGLELYRQDYAPRIILSVGRFEWRRFVELGLPDDGGLVDLVQTIPATERHFFVELEGERASCSWVRPGRFGTLSEATALAARLQARESHKILVVSSGEHLRRCLLALRTFLPAAQSLVPVSSGLGGDSTATELVKLLGYRLICTLARSAVS